MTMVGYLKSTRHAKSDRRVHERLKKYDELFARYKAEGMPEVEASKKAAADARDPRQ